MALLVLNRYIFILSIIIEVALTSNNDDFGFEFDDNDKGSLGGSIKVPVQHLYGIPDSSAYVGRLFHFKIPSDAFAGSVSHYEVSGMPEWMVFHGSDGGSFKGIPGDKDVGESYISVTAIGFHSDDAAKDVFAVEVLPDPRESSSDLKEPRCKPGQDATILTIVLDRDFYSIGSDDRIASIQNIAGFLAIDSDKFSLLPQTGDDDLLSETVIMAGPGNSKKKISKSSTILEWQIGCGGSIWSSKNVVPRIKQIAKDGTLTEVLQLPVLGWHLATSPFPFRQRREVYGSGHGEGVDETENETEDIEEAEPEKRVNYPMISPTHVLPESSSTLFEPHRVRHHGRHRHEHEDVPLMSSIDIAPHLSSFNAPVIMATPTLEPERPKESILIEEEQEHLTSSHTIIPEATYSYTLEASVSPDQFSPATENTMETKPLDKETTVSIETSTEHEPTYTASDSNHTFTPQLPNHTNFSENIDITTKDTDDDDSNARPVIARRLPKLKVTAGKILRFIIPDDTFNDAEDGDTRSLHIAFKMENGDPIPPNWWIQYNAETFEIYCLPLEKHVSKWTFLIEATDADGDFVNDKIEVYVQQHKASKAFNHEITLHLQPSDHSPIQGYLPLDQQILIVNKLASIFKDRDNTQITVVNVTANSFSWWNDSITRTECDRDEITNLVKVLAEDDGSPKEHIKELFLPEIDPVKITWVGRQQCEVQTKAPEISSNKNFLPKTKNFPPLARNPIDGLDATVGELLVYTVKEDSFYDPEDGNTRNLKLTLLNMEYQPLSPSHWFQFDVKNQEFYGIPLSNNTGRWNYQLVIEDSGGLTFNDVIVVEVFPARKILYNVEFSMTIDVDFDKFTSSPSLQRHFVEKVAELFGDKNTSAIVLSGMAPGSTVVTWHNRTLPVDSCPDDYKLLRQILVGDDERVSLRAVTVMGSRLPLLSASLAPTAFCEGGFSPTHVTVGGPLPPDVMPPTYIDARSEEYLMTVIVPAVVIAIMLLCAGLVACVLYRRRRTGKMSVGDEDERQSFRSKGIPVIFQDELEEKPEPTNKSPIIMKEEKPPLPPPEYQRSHPTVTTALLSDTEDSPYQPPPPFTSSRDSSRPKPTPTYRMPPPYVPP